MLILNEGLQIGQGRDRACYQHPENSALCVKVAIRPEKQTRRERVYFGMLMRQGKDTSQLALFRGMTETNLGTGAIFDLVRDKDGTISKTLREAIEGHLIGQDETEPLVQQLHEYLFSQVISVRDLSPNNLMLQRSLSGNRLIVIDGVSNPGVNPLNIRWPWLARIFLEKSWSSFSRKFDQLDKKS